MPSLDGAPLAQLRATRPGRAARPRSWSTSDVDVHQLASHRAYVRAWSRAYRATGSSSSASTRRSSRSSTSSIASGRRRGSGHRLPGRGRHDYSDLERFDNHYWPALYSSIRRPDPRPPLRRRSLRAIGARHPAAARHRRPLVPVHGAASRRRPTGTTSGRPRRILRYGPSEQVRVDGRLARAPEAQPVGVDG